MNMMKIQGIPYLYLKYKDFFVFLAQTHGYMVIIS